MWPNIRLSRPAKTHGAAKAKTHLQRTEQVEAQYKTDALLHTFR